MLGISATVMLIEVPRGDIPIMPCKQPIAMDFDTGRNLYSAFKLSRHAIMKYLTHVLIFTLFVSFALSTHAKQATMQIGYGKITAVEVTTKKSAAAAGTLAGAVVGLAIDNSISSVATGAATGFLVTSIIEGDRRVFVYTLEMNNGDNVSIAVARPDLSLGHCAALEQKGKHNNLRPVSSVHCLGNQQAGSNSIEQDNHRLSIAEKCHEARDLLSRGGSSTEIDAALRNLRTYCD